MKIDSQTHYDGNTCVLRSNTNFTDGSSEYVWSGESTYPVPGTDCTGTWPLKDLTDQSATASQLFNFSDLKPGDWGENTISLHVFNNDAWLCAQTSNTQEGIGITTEPELVDESGHTDSPQLLNSMQFFAWNDVNGNNIYEPRGGDTAYYSVPVPASQVIKNGVWAIADSSSGSSTGGQPVAGNSDPAVGTKYLGVAWCLGTMTVGESGAISCNGSSVNNKSQGDTASFDVTFTAVQSRNNAKFVCGQEAVLVDSVDIGNTDNESNRTMAGWSDKVWPANGGTWGGGDDGTIRTVSAGTDDTYKTTLSDVDDATVDMNFGAAGAKNLIIRHLDGAATNDSFDVFVNNVLVGHYPAKGTSPEVWETTSFPVTSTGVQTVRIHLTGTHWPSYDSWGQLGISWIKIEG